MLRRTLIFLFLILPWQTRAQEREAWHVSKIKGSPEAPPPYATEALWPHITFASGVDITLLESAGKLFVTERFGTIRMLPADVKARPGKAEPVIDLNDHIDRFFNALGLVFHPAFETNREIFIYYNVTVPGDDREIFLSRFRLDADYRLVPGSEENLIRFHAWGHTGGDMHFGPDGMLYFSVGDLSPPSPPDPRNEGQNLGTLASTISRIDVNHRDPGLAYRIPRDNPFIHQPGARPEIWAYGFRNPWKFCFRPNSGEIWTGDVGWEMWEMIYRVEKGGNYGWSIMEGPVPTKALQTPGPTPIQPPAAAYSHTQGASVTGGYFVTGASLPELRDAYLYADYVSGKVWALDWDGNSVRRNRVIADTRKQIVSFGQDLRGDPLLLEFAPEGGLFRLVPNPAEDESHRFPDRLSETGLFTDTPSQTPAGGVYPFRIKAPIWQDGYESLYWVAMPGKTGITSSVQDRRGYPLINYTKPRGMVLAKTLHRDNFKVETQILHWDGYWRGYSYRWNETQTDASLVRKEGLDTTIRGEPYHFPARDECIRCHGSNFNRPLAFFPGQMDRDGQLEQFRAWGIVDDVFVNTAKRQPLADPYDAHAPLELRARSWLHSNCSHCHKVSGGSGLLSMMNTAVPTSGMDLIGIPPSKGYFGLAEGKQIDPGNPYNSILYYRIATQGGGHMPMVGGRTLDRKGIQLIHDWIRSLDPQKPLVKPQPDPVSVEEALALYHQIVSGNLDAAAAIQAIRNCLQSKNAFVANLFADFSVSE